MWRELARRQGVKTFDLMNADMAAAHDATKRFGALLPEIGGRIEKTLFTPLGTTDHGSNIAQLGSKPAEALVMYMPGSAGIGLAKQQAAFGLFDKYKLLLSASMVNEILITGQADTTVGVWSSQSYHASLPDNGNPDFVKTFEAIQKARSAEVPAVRKALEGIKFNSFVGEVEMRAADHQMVRPMVVVQAARTAPGKAEVVVRSVEPAQKVTMPPSAECKM